MAAADFTTGWYIHTVAFLFQLLEFNTNCKTLRCVSNSFHFRIDRQQCGVPSCILYKLFFDERALVSVGSRTGLIYCESVISIIRFETLHHLNQLLRN